MPMKAVLKKAPKLGIEVEEVPIPSINQDEVLIKVKAAAICGSDLGIYKYTPAYEGMKLPVILGHEFSGDIVETGSAVESFAIGDRVLSESVKACGACGFCKEGRSNLCDETTLFGIHTDGAFAEYISVPYTLLHMIPRGMSYEEAALVEPLSNSVHFVLDITPFKVNDYVVVQGCGPIGLFSAQLFKLGGARVLLTGLSDDEVRFDIAKKIGIETIDIENNDLVERVLEDTRGKGADTAFVAVGAPSAFRQATEIVKKMGQVTVVGIFGEPVDLDLTWLVRRELVVKGAYDAKPVNFPLSIKLISEGKINVNKVLTHTFSLEDAEKAFKVSLERSGGKVEFIPRGSR
jgi:L-iditol 2-dehydrogenase